MLAMRGQYLRLASAIALVFSISASPAAGVSSCDMHSGCFWDAPMDSCACPGDSRTRINLKHHSYDAAAEVTTFIYGVACPQHAGNVTAWGLHTEPGLVIVSDASLEWTKEYSQGRHTLSTTAMVQCPDEMTFELTLQGKVGACSGQVFSVFSSSSAESSPALSVGTVPCSTAVRGALPAVVRDAATSPAGVMAAAASSVSAPVPAGRLHSTTETVTRSSAWEVASLKLQHAPASQSPSPATTLQSAMGQLDGIEEGLQSSYRCAELGEKLKKLREASHGLAQEFGHMAFQGSAPESADVAVEVSKRVVEVFLVGVKRWETNVWCPRGVQGAMRIMQVASEDWTRTFAALGEHGLHSSVQAAQAWADGLTTAGRTWIAMAQRTTCQQIPMMVSILNQIVTLASTSVASWVALTEAFTGNEAAKLEVMSVWMTAFETLTEDARSGALAWSDVCANQKSTLDQIDAASIALSQFVRHFSTQLAKASQQWASAFAETGASASAVVHASLLASSSFYVSDLAQISHTWATTWALRAATGTAVQQASQKWADAFQVVMADAAEKASAWHSACKDCSGDSDDAWMSFFEMISVSVDVAAEGWRHSMAHIDDGEHAAGAWDTVQEQLAQAAEQVAQAWNDIPSASTAASTVEELTVRIMWQDELQVKGPLGVDFVIRELDSLPCNGTSTCGNASSNVSILY
mmetsp:Transcript_24876/g.57756  ORF Transcript_24876/g.57756 Transcript_24876/m.57756 type:complete len:694 (+) Transcript_24876:119-2200(+)